MHCSAKSSGHIDDLLALGVVVGGDVGAGVVLVVVVDAVDERLALAGAAGVPADDVEAVEECRADMNSADSAKIVPRTRARPG